MAKIDTATLVANRLLFSHRTFVSINEAMKRNSITMDMLASRLDQPVITLRDKITNPGSWTVDFISDLMTATGADFESAPKSKTSKAS